VSRRTPEVVSIKRVFIERARAIIAARQASRQPPRPALPDDDVEVSVPSLDPYQALGTWR